MVRNHLHEFLRLAAKSGASYLDVQDIMDQAETAWFYQIDVDILDLDNVSACVLGQKFGDFYTGTSDLNLDRAMIMRLGFDSPAGDELRELGAMYSYPAPNYCYSVLTESWIDEIWSRRNAAKKLPGL